MGKQDEPKDKQEKKPRLNLTTSQVAASALAACCASIVASYLGVAGTVIGAAVGSVIATTGAAIWGHLFRRGGDKIKQTLLVNVNGQPVEVDAEAWGGERDGAAGQAAGQAVRPAAGPVIGRRYGAEADAAETRLIVPGRPATAELWLPSTSATGETRIVNAQGLNAETKLILGSGGGASDPTAVSPPLVLPSTDSPATGTGRLGALRKYRKPMGIAAAILAVFSISIVVGLVAGAPVRSAGSSTAPQTTTSTVTQTEQGQQTSSSTSKSSTDSTSTSGSGGTASQSPSSSSSGTSSSSASPSASQSSSATSGAVGGATALQHQATAANTGSGAP